MSVTPDTGATPVTLNKPELPPQFRVSARRQKRLPNWGLKAVMAITGVIGALFLAMHLFGNLKVYTGAEHFNKYAYWLRHVGEPLLPANAVVWVLRVVLAGCIVLHIVSAAILWVRGRKARGKFSAKRRGGLRSFEATLMPLTGICIALFVVFHIADLTLGVQPLASETFQEPTDTAAFAYQNLIASFSRPWSAAIYIVMMVLLSIHVSHGLYTVVSDLGALGKRLRAVLITIGGATAVFILLGNASIPIAVLIGVLS
ncbi:MAG: succinate dehydrogenase cytochrome b subunit [Propionibacteriaceae bacterium]|jgi:succinate dehydrogenase / fumarate reductase cytochrome b subunit|nr:succinate dehydrogenase cytochrome b subunit [Propionibacteriaceae bacterium]